MESLLQELGDLRSHVSDRRAYSEMAMSPDVVVSRPEIRLKGSGWLGLGDEKRASPKKCWGPAREIFVTIHRPSRCGAAAELRPMAIASERRPLTVETRPLGLGLS